MRNLTAGTLAEMDAPQQRHIHLLDIALDGQTISITDDFTDVVIGLKTYTATGHLLQFDHDGDADGMQINALTVTLSGVDQSMIASALQYDFLGRRLTLLRTYFDENGVIQAPFMLFDGRCDGPAIEESPDDGSCTVQVKASSHFVDFERVRSRLTNLESQQQWFPSDKGFEFVAAQPQDIQWGGA
ncbi:hypothetical protein R6242_14365 [Iodobacter sp. CM08]|uniref:hypothetical protein n=1 Tax=Iodobacter sp. CM08 TaxID=3085902 RepID=UPI002980EBBC|nr:hypothetical protein [Iodobacter sp. CM08]MDW5417751.1 hypothetical protein [Iodobacter sp. CM08]